MSRGDHLQVIIRDDPDRELSLASLSEAITLSAVLKTASKRQMKTGHFESGIAHEATPLHAR